MTGHVPLSERTHGVEDHKHDHSGDWKTYLAILVALLFLTVVTVTAASFDFGSANVLIAIIIATIKASLVALFFMHLRHDSAVNSIIFLSALLFLSFLLILCLIDVNSRIEPKPYNWKGPDPGVVSPAQLATPQVPGAVPAPGTPGSEQPAGQQAQPGAGTQPAPPATPAPKH